MKMRYKVAILAGILVLGFGTNNAKAHASVRTEWQNYDVECYKYHVQEYRRGVFNLNDLWRLNSTVRWCGYNFGYPTVHIWYGPKRIASHWENITWNWGGYVDHWKRTLHHPTRWQFYVKAQFNGNGAYLLTEHDYPWIRMTIWKRNPNHVTYTARCGC